MLMSSFLPWLAVAGIGALHGLNPAAGWGLAAASGVRSGDRDAALRALFPIAAGHVVSVLLVAAIAVVSVDIGATMEPVGLRVVAGILLLASVGRHLFGHTARSARRSGPGRNNRPAAGHAGLAIWSFAMSTMHGTGLMLVPALIPLCVGEGAVREITTSGSLAVGLAAVGVHMAAMLVVTGALAAAACRLFKPRGTS